MRLANILNRNHMPINLLRKLTEKQMISSTIAAFILFFIFSIIIFKSFLGTISISVSSLWRCSKLFNCHCSGMVSLGTKSIIMTSASDFKVHHMLEQLHMNNYLSYFLDQLPPDPKGKVRRTGRRCTSSTMSITPCLCSTTTSGAMSSLPFPR